MNRCAISARCRSEMRCATSLEAHIRNRRQFGAQRGWTIFVGDGAAERRGSPITTREQGSEAAWRSPLANAASYSLDSSPTNQEWLDFLAALRPSGA
jgi:hypothetical protein